MDEHAPGLKERIAQFFRIRRSSRIPTFKSFEFEDLRLPVADLDDFVPFDFQGKKTDQVLKLLKPVSLIQHCHSLYSIVGPAKASTSVMTDGGDPTPHELYVRYAPIMLHGLFLKFSMLVMLKSSVPTP